MDDREACSSSSSEPERLASIAGAFLSDNIRTFSKSFRKLIRGTKGSQRQTPALPSFRHSLADAAALPSYVDLQSRLRSSVIREEGHQKLLKHRLKPQGPGNNDRSMAERAVNVLTSVPFIAVGLQTRRARKTPEGKRFGTTMVSVGAAATAYHAAHGDLRCALRKLDYWTIALASTQMVRALFPASSPRLRALTATSLALMPFQPTAVSTANFGLAEVEFLRRSLQDKKLAKAYRRHAAIGGIGLCCFALEDVAIEHGHHFVHSLWHLNACYAVASTNALMQKREAPEGRQLKSC